jgi:type II secretory ATPase GspE/PulE/Tfp pilus assembly ATPase PilB-like protein
MSKGLDIDLGLIHRVDGLQANRYRVVPLGNEGEKLLLASDSQHPEQLSGELSLIMGIEVAIQRASTPAIDQALLKHYRQGGEELSGDEDFLDRLIVEAQSLGSSDIHVECQEKGGRVRMRIDGQLLERFQIPLSGYTAVVNKIKVRAGLDRVK